MPHDSALSSMPTASRAGPHVSSPRHARVLSRLAQLQVEPTDRLLEVLGGPRIIAVAAYKGGVGKTTLARELAWWLDAVLVDFDWDRGGASRLWGYRHEARTNAPMLDALESGRVPRPLRGDAYRPDLLPSHPDLVGNQPSADTTATALERWVKDWDRPAVVDTHPGGEPMTYGAMAAADLTIVPVTLEVLPLEGLEGMLSELGGYPMLIIPTMVPTVPPEPMIKQLEDISTRYGVPVGPPVSNVNQMRRRRRRMAVCASDPVPAAYRAFVLENQNVVKAVISYVGGAAA